MEQAPTQATRILEVLGIGPGDEPFDVVHRAVTMARQDVSVLTCLSRGRLNQSGCPVVTASQLARYCHCKCKRYLSQMTATQSSTSTPMMFAPSAAPLQSMATPTCSPVAELSAQRAQLADSWKDFYSRQLFEVGIQLVHHYYTATATTETQRQRLSEHLVAILAILPGWPKVPSDLDELINLAKSDRLVRSALVDALNKCPDGPSKLNYLSQIQADRR